MIKSGNYSIVHTHSSKAGILGRIAAKLAGAPIVIHTVHGWSYHEQMQPLRRQIYIGLEKLAANCCDCLIAVAEADIEKGLKEGVGKPVQYRLIRSAIPLEGFNPDVIDGTAVRRDLCIPEDVPVLGNVGRFSPQKNPFDWVRVANTVAERCPTCHFLLVGDGPLRVEVIEQFRSSGLLDRCIFTGLSRDVPKMLAAMDVFLLTSLWEGLPRVIPQSMAMGIPVVANRVDGTAEAIIQGKTGYLCNPGEIDTMGEYCVELLQNPALRKALGENSRVFVAETFDLNTMITQIEDLYDCLLEEKGLVV
jgi:glycosyltransferase involved in cell wall biosynthesis